MDEKLKAALEAQQAVMPKNGFATSSFTVVIVTYAVGLFMTFAVSKGWVVSGPETEQLKAGLIGLLMGIVGLVTYKYQQSRAAVTEAKSEATKVATQNIITLLNKEGKENE